MNDLRASLPPLAPETAIRPGTTPAQGTDGGDFSSLVKDTVNEVNKTQKAAAAMAEKFEMGDPNVDLVRVMVEMQKSRVSFEAVSQVRNKLVEAYREVMNMQV